MRTEFDPRAVRRSAARTTAAWLAHGLIYGLGYLPQRHRPRRARDIRTLVFVHGLAGGRANLLPLQLYLRARGHRRQLAFDYRSTGSVESIALGLRRHIDRNVKGGRIDLVCHSMGGLVARFYLQQLGGARRVDRLITLGTPHRGTTAAAYVPSALVSQLQPDGPFLEHLNGLPAPAGVECHAFGARRDLLVLPVESAFPPFGDRIVLENLGHMDMLLSPRVFAQVAARLAS